MTNRYKKILFWSPRIICILFAVFISIFALDVFEENKELRDIIIGLAIHLIPTFLIIVLLILSWKWEWIGGIFFIALGILYIVFAYGKFPLSVYFIISGPLFVVGALFLMNWFWRKEIRKA